jgi:hypothetical protein
MKKLLLLLTVFIISSAGVFAFDVLSYPPPVTGGNIMVDLGIGFTSSDAGKIAIPPLRLSIDYALPVNVPVSVGGLFAFHRTQEKGAGATWRYSYWTFGARGNWHWGIDVSWLDLYTGIFLGYQAVSYDLPKGYVDPGYGGFTAGMQVGAHFYFTDLIGAFFEFGYPYWANLGVALKF